MGGPHGPPVRRVGDRPVTSAGDPVVERTGDAGAARLRTRYHSTAPVDGRSDEAAHHGRWLPNIDRHARSLFAKDGPMITLTRLNGQRFAVNSDLIERVD